MRLHSFPVNRFEYFEVGGIAAHDFGVSADTRQVERDTSGKTFGIAALELIFHYNILAGLRVKPFHHVEHFRLKLHAVNIVCAVGVGVRRQNLCPALLNHCRSDIIFDDLCRGLSTDDQHPVQLTDGFQLVISKVLKHRVA